MCTYLVIVLGDLISTIGYTNSTNSGLIRIPEGHCWVEGDHYGHSMDSNNFGPASLGLVTAKASFIVWPPSRWQHIKSNIPKQRRSMNIVGSATAGAA